MAKYKLEGLSKAALQVFCSVLILALLLLLEYLQREAFAESSISKIIDVQATLSQSTIGFFRFINFIGDSRCFYVLLMIQFNLASRQTAFYFTFVISLCIFVEAFFKMVLKAGRPFMKSTKIFPYVCELSFSNPCGETMMSTAFIFAGWMLYLHKLKRQDTLLTDLEKFLITISCVFSILMIILFSLNGLFTGNNTIDEILFGMETGILIACFSHLVVRKRLSQHLNRLMDGLYVGRYRHTVLGFMVAFLSGFIVITIVYMTAVTEFQPPRRWLQ